MCSTAFVAETPPLPCVSTAFVSKTVPFLADFQALRWNLLIEVKHCLSHVFPLPFPCVSAAFRLRFHCLSLTFHCLSLILQVALNTDEHQRATLRAELG